MCDVEVIDETFSASGKKLLLGLFLGVWPKRLGVRTPLHRPSTNGSSGLEYQELTN